MSGFFQQHCLCDVPPYLCVTVFCSFSSLSSIPLCDSAIYIYLFCSWPALRRLLAELPGWCCYDILPRSGVPGHRACLCSALPGTTKQFSVVAPIDTPTNNTWEFQWLHILISTWCHQAFSFWSVWQVSGSSSLRPQFRFPWWQMKMNTSLCVYWSFRCPLLWNVWPRSLFIFYCCLFLIAL